MPAQKALNHYLGKNGHLRMNCAQSVMKAFEDRLEIDSDRIDALGSCGGGRAPEGVCGAYYAVEEIMKNHKLDGIGELEQQFIESTGSTKCLDIRMGRKLSCMDCIRKCAEFVDDKVAAIEK